MLAAIPGIAIPHTAIPFAPVPRSAPTKAMPVTAAPKPALNAVEDAPTSGAGDQPPPVEPPMSAPEPASEAGAPAVLDTEEPPLSDGVALPSVSDAAAVTVTNSLFDPRKLLQLIPQLEAAEAAGPWPLLDGPTRLELDNCDPQVAILRRQLERLGDLATAAPVGDCFDPALVAAVKGFQARHGLLADGVVGASSRRALNLSPAARLAQIKVNIERLSHARVETRYVLVNIPAFELIVIDQGRVVLRSPVVVGRPSRPTPLLVDQIVNLVLSPTWTPTPMIARKDILPKAQADPGFLVRNQIRVFNSWTAGARELNPLAVNWARISPARLNYRFRQNAGPINSLGQVRFSLTNDAHIYLHDTPNRKLFERPQRAASSGCVRVADALALALFALAANSGWSAERLNAVIGEQRTRTIKLANPVPIHLIYVTAWVDERGTAQFRDDIYGLDAVPATALNQYATGNAD